MTLRLGLVGIGKIARDQHIPALETSPDFELICGASLEGVSPSGTTYRSVEEMLTAEPRLQAVALCQPPQARFEAAHAALMADKHVLLEKPPGATVGEVTILAALARARGLTLFASWHSRHAAAVEAARAWLAERTIRSARIVWREDVRVWHAKQRWIWRPGGLGVFDPGINALSIATVILPSLRVTDAALSYPVNQQAPIAAELTLAAGDAKVSADFDFRQTGEQTWDIEVRTDDGALRLSQGGARLFIDGAEQSVAPAAEYPSLYARFAALIADGASDVDIRPLQLVADAFLCARRTTVERFDDP